MLEDIPKLVELGALGLICFILIFKGIDKMQTLTDSIKTLTETISKLQNQSELFQRRMEMVETRLTTLEELIRNELRDIKFDIEHYRRENNATSRSS